MVNRRLAISLAAMAMLLLAASGPLHQLGILSLGAAYAGLQAAVAIGATAVVVGLAHAVGSYWRGARRRALISAVAAAIAVFPVVIPARALLRARATPPIHDISTDLQRPPVFKALLDVGDGPRELRRGPQIDDLQRRVYPDIASMTLPVPPDMVFEEALETLSELEWQVEDGDDAEGRIEATVRSTWFGFKDDIVIRLSQAGSGTRVDVRAVARDAGNDMGRNADHVREFLAALRQ